MTPAIVSMSGVSFVFATPFIERCRIWRAACVYSCLTRSSSLTRGPCAGGSLTRSLSVSRQRRKTLRRKRTTPVTIAIATPATTSSQ